MATENEQADYQGWPNHVTWALFTHLSNTPEIMHRAQSIIADYNFFLMPGAVRDLKAWVIDDLLADNLDSDGTPERLLVAELVTHALGNVVWEPVVLALWGELDLGSAS